MKHYSDYKKTYATYHPDQLREIERTPLREPETELNWPLFFPYLMLIVLFLIMVGATVGIYFLIQAQA